MRKNSVRTEKGKPIDSISFYAAMSRMDGSKNIQRTEGYKMLRQAAYARQQELAEEAAGKKPDY